MPDLPLFVGFAAGAAVEVRRMHPVDKIPHGMGELPENRKGDFLSDISPRSSTQSEKVLTAEAQRALRTSKRGLVASPPTEGVGAGFVQA
jgi:hypothetical protein